MSAAGHAAYPGEYLTDSGTKCVGGLSRDDLFILEATAAMLANPAHSDRQPAEIVAKAAQVADELHSLTDRRFQERTGARKSAGWGPN